MRGRLAKASLIGKFSLMSLIPIVLLGVVLGQSIQSRLRARAVDDARRSAELIARIAIQPRLTPTDLRGVLAPDRILDLDAVLHQPSVRKDLVRVKIWSADTRVVYSDDHAIIGRRFAAGNELGEALRGKVASEVSDVKKAENAAERSYGRLLEVYVPLRFGTSKQPAGAFEMYLPYQPIAASIADDTRNAYLLLLAGLSLLYAVLFRIVARASRTLRRQAEMNRHQARHDALTDLPNRMQFRERVAEAIARGKRDGHQFALILFDLDRFKDINDTLGHHTGDLVLRQIGPRLADAAPGVTAVARLGGDEFAMLIADVSGTPDALAQAAQVLRAFDEPFPLDDLSLEIEVSAGVAVYPEHAGDVNALIQRADVAMYRAKEARSGCEAYTVQHDPYSSTRLTLLGELRGAIESGELLLHYQPKANLLTGEVTGVEALVRWRHPSRGLISPDEFIPLAEQTGLIRPLTLYVVERALRQCAAWGEEGLAIRVAVNLFVRNLLDADLPEQIERLLVRHPFGRGRLELEITESGIMADPARARLVLERLSAMGVRLAIDDFGTGYSSLAYLKRLPVHEIKIDKTFVMGMDEDDSDVAIVRSTIDLARNLGLGVVAEGVKSEAVWRRLAELGCDTAQGYYLSRPLAPADLIPWLRESGRLPIAPVAVQARRPRAIS
ncbi:MAG: hypothetical protein QOK04_2115 [Solirubrobacteraceae bacterium]|nr:hypothetical protein [Solirubrobacteraceae bacterium]